MQVCFQLDDILRCRYTRSYDNGLPPQLRTKLDTSAASFWFALVRLAAANFSESLLENSFHLSFPLMNGQNTYINIVAVPEIREYRHTPLPLPPFFSFQQKKNHGNCLTK